MDNWSYINYDDLIHSIINGNHSATADFYGPARIMQKLLF